MNTGNAIVIVGCIYLMYIYGFDFWLLMLIIGSVYTWRSSNSDMIKLQERKAELEIKLLEKKVKK